MLTGLKINLMLQPSQAYKIQLIQSSQFEKQKEIQGKL